MKIKSPRSITIFEGPDGGGKSTAAKDFAAATDADYVHFPAVKKIQQLSRIYVEAALPALKGERDVVFDRSWLSETPYGKVFRNGMDRVGVLNTRMLERLFMRCGTVVVKCMPSVDSCIATFRSRRSEEMLDDELQLRLVYDEYARLETGLPTVNFDYTKGHILPYSSIDGRRFTKHPATMKSVGNFDGRIIVIGPGFHDHNDYNCFHQFPFVDLNPVGKIVTNMPVETELTFALRSFGVHESEILWIDDSHAEELMSIFSPSQLVDSKIIAVGDKAIQGLYREKVPAYNIAESTELLGAFEYIRGQS